MDYQQEMRKLIDIVKQQSFSAPLEQTLNDLNELTTAASELTDRINIRVRKSLQPNDKKATKTVKSKAAKKATPFPSVAAPTNTQQPQNKSQPNNPTTAVSSQSDVDRLRQSKLSTAPIKPQPPI
ncbi:hypothetical protein GN241_08690 [Rhodobacteraceae bacterium IMCC1335]